MSPLRCPRCVSLLTLALAILFVAGTASAAGQQERLLYSFQGAQSANNQDGDGPRDLISDENGNLFGVTVWGGVCNIPHHLTYPCGTVFELSPPTVQGGAWAETVIYEFGTNPADGQSPVGNLVRDKQGNLFGVTAYSGGGYSGNFGCGSFFELSPPSQSGGAWTETILHNFVGASSDGCVPLGTLVRDGKGNIFGATTWGGGLSKADNLGGIFEMSPPSVSGGSWTETFVTNLNGVIAYPWGGLALGRDGNLYGGTQSSIFQVIPPSSPGGAWAGSTLVTFSGGDGSPQAVTIDRYLHIWGVTYNGGTSSLGTIFKVSPSGGSWSRTTMYSFQGGHDGAYPLAKMTFDAAGNLFGTTSGGGGTSTTCPASKGCGTVFRLSRGANGWSEKVLYRFQGPPTDGFSAASALLIQGGTIYGTTSAGGTVSPYFYGTVFALTQ